MSDCIDVSELDDGDLMVAYYQGIVFDWRGVGHLDLLVDLVEGDSTLHSFDLRTK